MLYFADHFFVRSLEIVGVFLVAPCKLVGSFGNFDVESSPLIVGRQLKASTLNGLVVNQELEKAIDLIVANHFHAGAISELNVALCQKVARVAYFVGCHDCVVCIGGRWAKLWRF